MQCKIDLETHEFINTAVELTINFNEPFSPQGFENAFRQYLSNDNEEALENVSRCITSAENATPAFLTALAASLRRSQSNEDDANLRIAQKNFQTAKKIENSRVPSHGKRWGSYFDRLGKKISNFQSVYEAIWFGQASGGFDHRSKPDRHQGFFELFEAVLGDIHPTSVGEMIHFSESKYSLPTSLKILNGRTMSNIAYLHMHYVLTCLNQVKNPQKILEIGAGYGGTVRMWLKNPLYRPREYYILDSPESLFFAETFLVKEFGRSMVCYADSPGALGKGCGAAIFLVPLSLFGELLSKKLDLVINTGSIGEMSEHWVDFYEAFLDQIDARNLFSFNFFGQPINHMCEGENLWGPRLSKKWRPLSFNTCELLTKVQCPGRNLLEAFYEKFDQPQDSTAYSVKGIREILGQRKLTLGAFAELMDTLRFDKDLSWMSRFLRQIEKEMKPIPKEALWVAEQLDKSGSIETLPFLQKYRDFRKSGNEACAQFFDL